MKTNYERHQRDYTILATSVVMEEFCGQRMTEFFHYKTTPLYFLVKDRVLYHYISDEDKWGRIKNWLEHHTVEDMVASDKELEQKLLEYNNFVKEGYTDKVEALQKIHQFMQDFTDLIVLVSDLLLYKDRREGFDELGLEIRKKYEHVHREQMELQIKILAEIEEELRLEERGVLRNMLSSEFDKFVENGHIPSDLKQRSTFFFASHSMDGEKTFNKEEAEEKLKELEVQNDQELSQLKGQIAFQGVVRGRVRLISLIEDAAGVEEGDILVTGMTDPRYVPAMKKAAGFITDEGGITCHAAIVAREMKKPCIIGTKFATAVLQDGDYIELDAQNNKVTIIK